MKISQLYESTIQFGGLRYQYQRFEVGDDTFNFIHYNNSSGMLNVHLSNYESTPATTVEVLEPMIVYETVDQLHSILKKTVSMTEALIPYSMKSKEMKCWYLLRSNDLGKLESDMEEFKTNEADVQFLEQTKFAGQNYCKFEIMFKPK